MIRFRKLPKSDRRVVAEKVMEFGNIASGTLLLNQFINDQLNISAAIFGIITIVVAYFAGILYLRGD